MTIFGHNGHERSVLELIFLNFFNFLERRCREKYSIIIKYNYLSLN